MTRDTTVTKIGFVVDVLQRRPEQVRSTCFKTTALLFCVAGSLQLANAQALLIRGSLASSEGVRLQGSVTIIEGTRDVRVNSFRTDARGEFTIPTTWAPQKRVSAKADGFVSSEAVISASPGQQEVIQNFSLSPSASVSGQVVDESGVSVPEATVRVRYVGESRTIAFSQEVGAIQTDDFGYFSLPIVARGKQFILDVVSDDRPLSSSGVISTQSSAVTNVLLRMTHRGYPVSGRITNTAGQPVAGMRVRIAVRGDLEGYSDAERGSISFTASVSHVATTNAEGLFVFNGIPSGKITLIVGGPQNRTRKEATVNQAPLDVNITLAQ